MFSSIFSNVPKITHKVQQYGLGCFQEIFNPPRKETLAVFYIIFVLPFRPAQCMQDEDASTFRHLRSEVEC